MAATIAKAPAGAQPRWQTAIALGTLAISAVLLFARLGHYALWYDEAYTALNGEAICRTGDTTVVVGQNIHCFEGGRMLHGFSDHMDPPLQAYLVAPFTAIADEPDAGLVRLPFALCGLGTIALILRWLRRDNASVQMWVLVALGILGNVSLFLYCRQCRYYALSILLATWIAYVYVHWDGRRRGLILMAALSVALLSANQLNYAMFCIVLGADYLLWGRRRRALQGWDWVWLLLPQIICGGLIVWVWNPVAFALVQGPGQGVADKLKLIWWYVHDMNACEFGAITVWAALPIVYFLTRDTWLLRGALALALCVVVLVLLTPQNVHLSRKSDLRYIAMVIPLCIALGASVLRALSGGRTWAALALGAIAYGSNLLNGGPWLESGLQCTPWRYVHELIRPPLDPYRAAADWINANVTPGQSVWVLPAYATSALIYHAPGALYAWQLQYPPAPQFKNLAPIYFFGQELPDFIVALGPYALADVVDGKQFHPGVPYEMVAQLPVYGLTSYRPELAWRSFSAHPCDLRQGEGIYIFRSRKGAPF